MGQFIYCYQGCEEDSVMLRLIIVLLFMVMGFVFVGCFDVGLISMSDDEVFVGVEDIGQVKFVLD